MIIVSGGVGRVGVGGDPFGGVAGGEVGGGEFVGVVDGDDGCCVVDEEGILLWSGFDGVDGAVSAIEVEGLPGREDLEGSDGDGECGVDGLVGEVVPAVAGEEEFLAVDDFGEGCDVELHVGVVALDGADGEVIAGEGLGVGGVGPGEEVVVSVDEGFEGEGADVGFDDAMLADEGFVVAGGVAGDVPEDLAVFEGHGPVTAGLFGGVGFEQGVGGVRGFDGEELDGSEVDTGGAVGGVGGDAEVACFGLGCEEGVGLAVALFGGGEGLPGVGVAGGFEGVLGGESLVVPVEEDGGELAGFGEVEVDGVLVAWGGQ